MKLGVATLECPVDVSTLDIEEAFLRAEQVKLHTLAILGHQWLNVCFVIVQTK